MILSGNFMFPIYEMERQRQHREYLRKYAEKRIKIKEAEAARKDEEDRRRNRNG